MAIPILPVTVVRDQPRTFDVGVYFSDPDGDVLTYAATSSNPLIVVARVAGSEVTLTGLGDGAVTVTLTATDSGGLSASQTFTTTVGDGNRAPTAVGSIPDQTLRPGGSPVTLDVAASFSDPDGDQLTFQVSSSDSGIVRALVSESDLILVPVAAGTATVTVTATDPGGLSATLNFEVTVGTANRAPVAVGSIPDQTLTPGGSPVTLDVAASFSDPDGDELTFQATSSDPGVVRALISGTELILVPVAAGTATVTVTATDPGGLSATLNFEVTVGTANRAPVAVGGIPDQSLTPGGSPVTLDVAASFSDPDGDALTFEATPSDSGVVRALVSGTDLILIPVAIGTASVTVTATDPGGLSANQTFEVTVGTANRAPTAVGSIPDQALVAGGSAATVDVSSYFTDPDRDVLTYAAISSDSGVVRVLVSENEAVLIPGPAGTATITVTATDPAGLTAAQTFGVTVAAADDHGNTEGAATTVSAPSTTDGELEIAGDVDYFHFQLLSSGTLTVYTTGTTDTVGVLTGPNGLEETNDDSRDSSDGDNFRIVVPQASVGQYYVSVTGYGSATGPYELRVIVTTTISTPANLRVSDSGDDFIAWSWDDVEDATGYEVQFRRDLSFSEADRLRFVAGTSVRGTELSSNTEYFLRVRAIAGTSADRLESSWSSPVRGVTVESIPLDDFHMAIDGDRGRLEICVRDWACEDGDLVDVYFDGRAVFQNHELFNDWNCRTVDVEAGRSYLITLQALNDTQRKCGRNCGPFCTGRRPQL